MSPDSEIGTTDSADFSRLVGRGGFALRTIGKFRSSKSEAASPSEYGFDTCQQGIPVRLRAVGVRDSWHRN
jgi:hypothetical protein